MSCNKCNVVPCMCVNYANAAMCEEDISVKIYEPKFSFGLCACRAWNVPACGQTALVPVSGALSVPLGAYIWHEQYGYFKISSIDPVKQLVGITNDCTVSTSDAGVQVPANTCFVVTAKPQVNNNGIINLSDLFPYVALDFIAPPNATCINISVTTIAGLSVGDVISIGSGQYTLDSIVSDTVIRICNNGLGITPNTPVIAKDPGGQFIYPLYVVSSCCVAVQASINALTTTVTNNNNAANASFADLLGATVEREVINTSGVAVSQGNFVETANTVLLDILNTSPTRSRQVFISYEATFGYQYNTGLSDVGGKIATDILVALNGSPTFNSIFLDGSSNAHPDLQVDYIPTNGAGPGTQYAKKTQGSVIYTVGPASNLTIVAKARINALVLGLTGVTSHFRFRGITVRV